MSQRIAVLKNIRKNLPIKERILFFKSMIKPVMLYGSPVWDSCSRENIAKISKLQKRAACVILEADSDSLFKQLNWLTIRDEIEIRKCCVIYKRNNGLTPSYINDILVRNVDTHSRSTRHCDVILVWPKYKRARESEGDRTFQVSGTKLWHAIPVDIKKKESYNSLQSHFPCQINFTFEKLSCSSLQ